MLLPQNRQWENRSSEPPKLRLSANESIARTTMSPVHKASRDAGRAARAGSAGRSFTAPSSGL